MKNITTQNFFSKLMDVAKNRIDAMPESKTKKLKEALEHGLAEFKTEDEMDMYLTSYGTMHQEKLMLAFENIPRKILREDKVSIIDYGCGQGIASLVLCDLFQSIFGHPYTVSDFHLIEPALACLKRAVKFIHSFNSDARIVYFNNPCEDIWSVVS